VASTATLAAPTYPEASVVAVPPPIATAITEPPVGPPLFAQYTFE